MGRYLLPVALLLGAAGAYAQVGDAVDLALKLRGYYSKGKYIYNSPKYLTNYRDCRARGATDTQCKALAGLCALQEAPLFGRYAGVFRSLGLNQVFKLDCGSQECFQCCHVPGQGCHTSFVGFPVINCNPRYGEGTNAAGLTLVTDPDAQPGEACLTIPQTCEHIPRCAAEPPDLPGLRERVDNGEDLPVNAPGAVPNRAKFFARQIHAKWCESLDRFHTGLPRDPEFPGFETVDDVRNFLTGRGCVGWRAHIGEIFPFDWEAEFFAVTDEEGAVLPGPSHRNALCQLGLIRVLESVPNLADRLAFVDSTFWPEPLSDAYLMTVGDPDDALRHHAHPIVRDLLACNPGVDDYRLLSVPLEGEEVPERVFNGCDLGEAPQIFLDVAPAEPNAVSLRVEVRDPEVGGEFEAPVPLTVFWGDGRVSQETVPAGAGELTVQHGYGAPGGYAIYAMAENTSGLRGFATAVAATGAGEPVDPGPVVVSEVRLVDVVARANTLSGNTRRLYIELEGHDPTDDSVYRLGMSPDRGVEFNVDTPMGTLIAYNTGAAPIDRLILRPHWRDGFYTGFRKALLRIGAIELHVFDPSTGESAPIALPVAPEAFRAYVFDQAEPLPPEAHTLDEAGQLEVFLHDRDRLVERIEIDLPQGLLAAEAPGVIGDDYAAPAQESWYEERPERFVAALRDPDMAVPDMGMDDMGVGGEDAAIPVVDGGVDGGAPPDGGAAPDAGGSTRGDGGDGGCTTRPGRGAAPWWILMLGLGIARRRR